jgi:peptide/nickel transport system substrate-binding protein
MKQAPMLQEMVDAGTLPPLEERLPTDVMVVTPVDGVGEYGGTWHNVTWDPGAGNIKMILYDAPVRWKRDYTGYEPGLARRLSGRKMARRSPSTCARASSGRMASPIPPPT